MDHLATQLFINGPLGILCVVLLYAVIHLYRDKAAQERRHREEMKALMEHHIAKAESWVATGNELVTKLNAFIEAALRKGGRS